MDKPQEVEFANLLFGGIGIIVILVLIIVVFVALYQRKLFIQQVYLHKIELTHRHTVLEAAINSQESERERIAQDLHDEVGAALSTAKLFVNQIRYESSSDEMKHLASQSSQVLGDVIQDVRKIAYNLSPLMLKNLGLEGAITTLLNRVNVASLATSLTYNLSCDVLSNSQQLILYRIIQEALGNALKHAEATQINLRLDQHDQHVRLQITDNGKGFDYQNIQDSHRGLGINSIKSRAELLNGELTIQSDTGKGTSLELICRCV